MSEAEHKPACFDEEAFDAAVAKPNGWSKVADPVAEIRRMRGDASPGNAAAMREALESTEELLEHFAKPGTMLGDAFFLHMRDNRAALAAPARNCDRFQTAKDALDAFIREKEIKKEDVDNMNLRDFFDWLFAPAEGGDHA